MHVPSENTVTIQCESMADTMRPWGIFIKYWTSHDVNVTGIKLAPNGPKSSLCWLMNVQHYVTLTEDVGDEGVVEVLLDDVHNLLKRWAM